MSDLDRPARLTSRELFVMFLRAGLAFGGGLAILAALEQELVRDRRIVSRDQFLTNYALARIVPSGTMTAIAVAYGYRFGGFPGTVVALAALTLPAFVLTVALTMAYHALARGPALSIFEVTVLPTAVAFIVSSAVGLARDVARPSPELAFAVVACLGVLVFDVDPSLLLILGGVVGALVLRGPGRRR